MSSSKAARRYAEVAVDAAVGLGRTFSYSIPASLDMCAGQLVDVPFGPRRLRGVVFSLASTPQVAETRDIHAVVYEDPVLSETALKLARWVGDYYRCSLFEAAAPMLPPGGRLRPRTYLTVTPDSEGRSAPSLDSDQRRAVEYIAGKGRVDEERLVRALGPRVRSMLRGLVRSGLITRHYGTAGQPVGPRYREQVYLAPSGRGALDRMPEIRQRAPRQTAFIDRLSRDEGTVTLTEARKEFGASAVNALLARGWVSREAVQVDRDPLEGRVYQPVRPVALTPYQQRAASEVRAALDSASPSRSVFLLQGVTGSGKTEVYLDAVARCIELGRKAIVLVPEIALTPQTIERFASRFTGQVAVLHSGLSQGQRFDQWWKIARGRYDLVVGSRGAVFAPQPELGLIVLDEEHEWTYKQHDSTPRYHARDVALELAGLTAGVVVMGSASPDVESFHRAVRGNYRLLSLPRRVFAPGVAPAGSRGGQGLAQVEVVDMRRELREGNRGMFSGALMEALNECLDKGDQAILFLNRRGTASHLQCRNCGLALRCRRCDVTMTYHRAAVRLVCHYCGERRRPTTMCPRCLSFKMGYLGIGTQAVVDEVAARFPGLSVLRWDRDTTTARDAYEELLERFRSGDAQVMVGTQMVAKGLHFPSVTVVGVVAADIGLHVPDFRAGERSFQLLCQVAGRAGRGASGGRVIIQTFQPDNYAVKAAARQDYEGFYGLEIAHRGEQGNPPFSRLVRLLYAHTNRARCEGEVRRLASALTEQKAAWGFSDVELLGPTPAYPSRLKGHYRWQFILRGQQPRILLDRVAVPQGWTVDVDPLGVS